MRQRYRKLIDPPEKNGPATVIDPTVRPLSNKPGVLVVDDDHLVRIVVQLGLERNGFDVWLARNGRNAIDFYRKHKENIILVLLEVRMPCLDGCETLDALRELNPDLPACFMTDNVSDDELEELLKRRHTYIIAKPFLLDDLANIVRRLAPGMPADLLSTGSKSTPSERAREIAPPARKSGKLQGS